MKKLNKNNRQISPSKSIQEYPDLAKFEILFCKMDIEGLADLLDENIEYPEDNKWLFVEDLRNKMAFFKLRKDTYFQSSNGVCTGCSIGKEVLIFKGNHSGVAWSFCLETENDLIKSIYECATFNPCKE